MHTGTHLIGSHSPLRCTTVRRREIARHAPFKHKVHAIDSCYDVAASEHHAAIACPCDMIACWQKQAIHRHVPAYSSVFYIQCFEIVLRIPMQCVEDSHVVR